MRITLLVMLSFVFSLSVGAQESDKEKKQLFWNTNIAPIVSGDMEKVLSQTHFPLEVKRSKRENLTREKFKAQYKSFFTPYVTEQLKSGSINDIDAWTMEGDAGPTYMLVCSQSEESEAVFVFCFKEFDGQWKLYLIDEHLE